MKTKTRFHKLTAWLLTLAMLMTFIPSFTLTASAADVTGTASGIKYTIDEYGVMTLSGSSSIPKTWCSNMTSEHRNLVKRIVIPSGFTSIGQQAFYSFSNLTSVSIPSTVTTLSSDMFSACGKLKSVVYYGTKTTSSSQFSGAANPTIFVLTDYSSTTFGKKTVTKVLSASTKELAVHFDMCGYGTQVDSQYLLDIDGYNKVTEPTEPSVPEIVFEGWYKDASYTTKWDFENDIVTADTTIYAKWNTTADCTVSFNMGSYGTAIDNRDVVGGSLIAEPETPTDENGVFLGWYKDSAFNTAWDFAADTVTANTTLYAKWRAIEGTKPQNGDGSEESPYEIGTADELYWFADYYNNSGLISEAHAILTADITVNQNVLNADGTLNGDGSNLRAWTPIGKYPNGYKGYIGTFDGQGYAISGLYFNNEDETAGNSVGLFGYVGRANATGTIRNVEVLDSYFKGYQNVGGIVGLCSNYNFSIENCKSAATVYAKSSYAGGIVGYRGIIKNCLAIGNVSAPSYVGAIVGWYSTTSHTNCYYLTGCAVNDSGVVQTGGGYNSTTSASNKGENTNYYGVTKEQLATGEVTYKLQHAQEDDSVVVWGQQLTGENAEAYPTLGGPRVVLDTATGTYINNEEGSSHTRVRGYCCDNAHDEPVLVDDSNYTSLGLTSDYIGYYAISNYGQLYGFAKIVNGGDYDANAVLTDNILANENVLKDDGTLNGDEQSLWQWNPILPAGSVESSGAQKYEGTFDGNNKYISGLYYNNSVGAVRGLFGYVGETGTIKDLGIVDSYFYGQRRVGSIAGSNSGTITNCYNEGTVKAYPKSTTGMMNDSAFLGGIAGYNAGKIEGCYNKGYISGGKDAKQAGGICGYSSGGSIDKCYNIGKVDAWSTAGGIVGELSDSTVSNSYNKGDIYIPTTSKSTMGNAGGVVGKSYNYESEPVIEKCWNSGTVTSEGASYIGGIVGCHAGYDKLTVQNCYNIGKVEAKKSAQYIGGIIGSFHSSAANVKIKASYNYGSVSGATYVGGILGRTKDGVAISDCYYLEGCAVDSSSVVQNGVGNETAGSTTEDIVGETTALTLEQMTDDTNWKTNFAGFDTTNVWSKDTNTASTWNLPKLDSNSPSVVPPHIHSWNYTVNDTKDTITATCTADGCSNTNGGSVIIAAPDSLTYTGDAIEAKVTNNLTTGDTVTVVYTPADKITDGKPVNAGTYTASITIGGKTAYVEYTIVKADTTVPSDLTAVYGQKLSDVTLPNGWTWVTPADRVGDVGAQAHKANYAGDDNHNAASNVEVTVTVSQSGSTMTANADKSAYTYGETVTITVSGITPTGEAAVSLFSLASPTTNQVAIWNGTTQLTEPQTVTGSSLTFTIAGLNVGSYTLIAKFTGNENMAATSADVSVIINIAEPTVETPTNLTATYGETLADVTLPTADNGKWTWTNEGTTSVGDAGTQSHKATFTPTDTKNYKTIEVDVPIEVAKATIDSVSFNVTEPEALADKQTSVKNGTNYTAAIEWNTTDTKFGFNTDYTATVKLTADSNHKFADEISVDGWNKSAADGVLTFVKTFDKTRKAKLTGYTAPSITNNTFSEYHANVNSAIAELPTTVTYQTESGNVAIGIEWSCSSYNSAINETNTFAWTVKNGELLDYETNSISTTGTITVTNAAAISVTHTKEDKETTYNGTVYDVSQMFTKGETTGTVSYEVISDGTGAGTLSGKNLTITKAGTIHIKMSTAADAQYAASNITATLTVKKADGTGTVSMAGWTYGETAKEPAVSDNKGAATYQYKVKGADDSTYSSDKPSNAGTYTVKAIFAATDLYNEVEKTADFTIAKANAVITVNTTPIVKTYGDTWELPTATSTFGAPVADIKVTDMVNAGTYTVTYSVVETDNWLGAEESVSVIINPMPITGATVGTFVAMTYTGSEQTPSAAVTIDGLEVTGTWSDVINVADKTTFTAYGNFIGTIADKETGMTAADMSAGITASGYNGTYDGEGHTITVSVSGVAEGATVKHGTTEGTYDLDAAPSYTDSGSATVFYQVTKTNYETVTGSATVEIAKKKIDSAIVLTAPVKNETPQTEITGTGYTATVVWSPEVTDKFGYNTEYTATVTITTDGNHTVEGIAADGYTVEGAKTVTNEENSNVITVAYEKTGSRPSSGGGSSNTTTTTTKNDDGSTTKTTTNKSTGTTTETTSYPDGSTTKVETKKDGTVTTTEKDKDGNTTTTVENPDGSSTTTEKNKDGSETVVEKDTDGTTTTTEKDSEGNKTVTTEKADGTTTTEETKKDGTTVKTETTANGETTAEVEAKGETEVVIPVENADEVTKVVVTDKDGNETEVEFEVKDGGIAISVSGNSTVSVQTGHICYAKDFTDVDLNAWYHLNIDYVLENGLFKGTTETTFAPNDNLTRAMLVTVLYRAEGEPATNRSIPFADVDMGSYYANAVIWAQQNGIVKGVSETEFAPNDNITREQIAALLYRYAIYKGMDAVNLSENLSFTDADDISEYAISALNWAVGTGLIKGYEDNTVRPLNNATRAEAAALLERFIEAN